MEYVLALFDIRAKQKFIYRSNKIKEIVGGSMIIRDLFNDYLYNAAEETGVKGEQPLGKIKKYETGDVFSHEQFESDMKSGMYCGQVVYDGGGNLLVLFKNEEVCREAYKRFTRKVLKTIPTLNIVCTWQNVSSWDMYHRNYPEQGDYEKLYAAHRFAENQELLAEPYWTVPMAQVDYATSMPLTQHKMIVGKDTKLTSEQYAKYEKYEKNVEGGFSESDRRISESIRLLDEMVEQKGKNSLLAIVYMDGNNIGMKYRGVLESITSYDDCINELRTKSNELYEVFVEDTLDKVDEELNCKLLKQVGGKMNKVQRYVIYSGDEVNIILPAGLALDYARTYLDKMNRNYHSCAGIAVFHSHAPFADAYRIAEKCCENAKTKGKEINPYKQENSLVDFHYCRAAIGVELKQIREDEHLFNLSRPWFVNGIDENQCPDVIKMNQVDQMARILNQYLGHSNIKGLIDSDIVSDERFEMEFHRILAHMSTSKKEALQNEIGSDVYTYFRENRRLIRDIVEFYDIWFSGESET